MIYADPGTMSFKELFMGPDNFHCFLLFLEKCLYRYQVPPPRICLRAKESQARTMLLMSSKDITWTGGWGTHKKRSSQYRYGG